ncbi:SKI family transcriptional corepressor 1 homolog-B isoform X2 [Dunckerocampus dactyliophorus]|uniref:SKI family transcriptional corepressor 1 homolog-B isoform X2 n=1 Tax=Dunckerocampus dactyliophorus TaxID=161453 RepID=UPI002405EDEC|nr:SKI family transcriptional corepressor 1 homolog-B isoform X2 [Dunckerocampus dactyliophorus]
MHSSCLSITAARRRGAAPTLKPPFSHNMEPIPAGRDSSSSPGSKQELSYPSSNNLKPNQVGETVLYGIPIVSLVIDGQERLCLAQISNTLLKNYSYNEIHNRRVALGITCVQCTPVQLEILRRAGAMPISSRRCGMITKREAERLCKSFLGAHSPPKLPENFAFDVTHECAWGSRGSFIPARYNSSRAKCIKCSYCNMYFSPNKFIFHSHRTPESKYTQPDAANFNSWRRHLKLSEKSSQTDILHAWEDVKAMFNGGSRKRTMPGAGSESSSPLKSHGPSLHRQSPDIPAKILSCEENRVSMGPRSYPVIPVPSKGFGMLQKIPPPLFPHPYGFPAFGLCPKKDDNILGEQSKAGLPGVLWPGTKDSGYPSFPVFWPAAGSLPMPPYTQSPHKPPPELLPLHRHTDVDISEPSDRSTNTSKDSIAENERCSSTQSTRNEDDKSGDEGRPLEGNTLPPRKVSYVSAFRPVVKDADCIAKLYGNRGAYTRTGYLSPDFLSESSSYRSMSPCVDSDGEADVDVETNKTPEDEDDCRPLSLMCPRSPPGLTHSVSSNDSDCKEAQRETTLLESQKVGPRVDAQSCDREVQSKQLAETHIAAATFSQVYTQDRSELQQRSSPYHFRPASYQPAGITTHDEVASKEEPSSTVEEVETKSFSEQSSEENQRELNDDDEDAERALQAQRNIQALAKEELQKQLLEQVELRKKLEREFQHLKDNFQDQMKRELSYREEMVQQLHIVRAHDALHHFSCKMLTPRHCTGSCTFKSPLLPP